MKQWEKRLEHDRDVINIQCMTLGIKMPDHPTDGLITPKRIWSRFDGNKFWPLMKELGHTSLDYRNCECCCYN